MKMFKKISAIALVVAMMLTMVSFTAFAAGEEFTLVVKDMDGNPVTTVRPDTKVKVEMYLTPGEHNMLGFQILYGGEVVGDEIICDANDKGQVGDEPRYAFSWYSTVTATADAPVATIPVTIPDGTADGAFTLITVETFAIDGENCTLPAPATVTVSGPWDVTGQEAIAVDVPVCTSEADVITELNKKTVLVTGADGKSEAVDVVGWEVDGTYNSDVATTYTFKTAVTAKEGGLAVIPGGFEVTATVNVNKIPASIPTQNMTYDVTGSDIAVATLIDALPDEIPVTADGVTGTASISWVLADGESDAAISAEGDSKAFTGTATSDYFSFANTVEGTVTLVNNLNYRDVVATVGEFKFDTLQKAVTAYDGTADIVLYNNPNEWIDPATATTVDKNVTIDLNDKIYTGASITVEDGNTVTFKGNGTVNADITGDIVVEDEAAFYGDLSDAKVTAAAGSFPADTDVEVAEAGLRVATLGDGRLAVVKGENEVTDKIYLEFRPTAERNVFEIYIEAEEGKDINEFVSAEFDFENNSMGLVSGGYVDYTIVGAAGIEAIEAITADPDKTGESRTWGFYVNDKDDHNAIEPAAVILLGTVTFDLGVTAPGTIDFKAVDGVVHTNKVGTNDEYHYYLAAEMTAGVDGELDFADSDDDDDNDGNITGDEGKVEPAKRNVVVNVKFVNDIKADVDVDYNDMQVSITGNYPGFTAAPVALGEPNTNTDDSATFEVFAGFRYTVTVEGAGYRTARYTTIVGDDTTDDLNLYFWNDVKNGSGTPYQEIEVGVSGLSAKNFLAGDIVMDGLVDKYDLAAVASYFGTYDLDDAHLGSYVKYDLNRDGQIDSEDIAYVLYSIGE